MSETSGPWADAYREKWTWGRLHTLRFAPLWREGWAGQDDEFGPFPDEGDGSSVRIAEYRPLESFDTRVVSGYRFIVDTADLDQALTALDRLIELQPGLIEGHLARAGILAIADRRVAERIPLAYQSTKNSRSRTGHPSSISRAWA